MGWSRVPASIAMAIGFVACTGAPKSDPRPPTPTSTTSASGSSSASSATTAPSSAKCTVDAECPKATSSGERAVCEAGKCASWNAERLLAWGKEQMPSLESVAKPPTLADATWLKGKKSIVLFVDTAELWSQGAPKACVPLTLDVDADVLVAGVPVKYGEKPNGNGVWTYALTLGTRAEITGPGMRAKTKDGESVTGTGCMRMLGHHLQSPTEDALRYRGALIRMGVACDFDDLEKDPRCPTCVRCARFVERRESLEPMYGSGVFKKPTVKVTTGETPTCIACPEKDVRAGQLDRFRTLTEDRITIEPDISGPAFFRTSQACEADRKARLAAAAKN